MKFFHFVFRQFLEDEEKILRIFRKKLPLGKIVLSLLLAVLLGEGIYRIFFCAYSAEFCPEESLGGYVYAGIIFLGIYKALRIYFSWYSNGILMTSESLLFVWWKELFSPKSARLDYWDLDMIEVDRSGLKSRLGNFGNLIFHKISGGEPIVFEHISKPHKAESVLMKNREKMVDEKNFTEESALKDLISQLVQTHVRKNGQPERLSQKKSQEFLSKKDPEEETHHFENEIEDVEKKLDDTGGIGIDL